MDAMSAPDALVELSPDPGGGLDVLTMKRVAKANALDAALVRALDDALRGLPPGRAVAIRSAHRAFAAGFDLDGVERLSKGDLLLRFVELETLLQRLRRGPLLSIAVVEGAAYGAGADLALACAWRVGAPKARFRFPGFRFGVALGTRRLAAVAGADAARRILLENRIVGAEEALELGLLTHLVEPGETMAAARALAAASGDLPEGAPGRILSLTEPDSDDADLADLVRSLAEGDLHARIAAYVAARDAAAARERAAREAASENAASGNAASEQPK